MFLDAYTIPRIDDTLHLLGGAKYLSTLDLKRGYWQLELKEENKAKNTFQVSMIEIARPWGYAMRR